MGVRRGHRCYFRLGQGPTYRIPRNDGFTLIEVLLALAILAIALTALLKASGENIAVTSRLKDKIINHWVAMQGIAAVQVGLEPPTTQPGEQTRRTQILNRSVYWRIKRNVTAIPHLEQITITVSAKQAGPFHDPLIGFAYKP